MKILQQNNNTLKVYLQGSYFEGNKKDYQAIYELLKSELKLNNAEDTFRIIQDEIGLKKFSE